MPRSKPWSRRFVPALLLLCAACQDPDFGSGPIALGPAVQASFDEYMTRDAPACFAITGDGFGSYYVYCVGGFNCTTSAARLMTLDRCRGRNSDQSCKLYAIGRHIVWQAGARPPPGLSASEQLSRECLAGHSPAIRIQKCSDAIASAQLAERDKRGPFYVRGRAYEQTGDLDLAEQDYRAVLSIDPDHQAARERLDRLVAPAAAPE